MSDKKRASGNYLIILIIESIFLFLILIITYRTLINQENIFKEKLIQQNIERFSSKVEAFIQTGQIILNSYASSLNINDDVESLALQLKKALAPFPFFSQLNIIDSSGKILAGFPQNNYEQQYPGFSTYEPGLTNDVAVFYKKKGSSIILFTKEIKKSDSANSLFLFGESDLLANPLNIELTQILSSLNQKVKVSLFDESGVEFLQLGDSELTSKNLEKLERIDTGLAIQNWRISFTYLKENDYLEAFNSMIPLLILVLILEGMLIFWYFRKEDQELNLLPLKGNKNNSNQSFADRLKSFRTHLIDMSSLEGIGQLLLNYVELEVESSIRVIFFETPMVLGNSKTYAFGSGKNSDEYSYLDEQIGKLINEVGMLEIPDLHNSNKIHLRMDKPYPLAIYAQPIYSDKTIYGFIWFGFAEPFVVPDSEKNYIQNVIAAAQKPLVAILRYEVYKEIALMQNNILESIPMPILMLGNNDEILYSNQEASRCLDFHGDIAGKRISDLLGKDFSAQVLNDSSGGIYRYEQTKGSVFLIHFENIHLDGEKYNKVLVFEDISSQENWKTNFTDITSKLSHDLRAPLATIKGYLTMLPVMGQVNSQQKAYIEKGIHQVEEMNEQIKKLFLEDRLESKSGLMLEEFEINNLLDDVIKPLQLLAEQKRITIGCDYQESSKISIKADSTLIKMALKSVIENAIQFTPNQGKVIIRTGKVQDMAEISIEDNGVGIAAVDLPHIFEKYYRMKIKNGINDSKGGQSLAMVKSIVEKHEGEVGVVSELGKGSTFFIRLPINIK